MKIRKEVSEACEIPKGYGIAYRDYYRRIAICYPIPFNFLAGWLRTLYWWLSRGYSAKWEKELDTAHQTGRAEGYETGYKRGMADAKTERGNESIRFVIAQRKKHSCQ
jgi:hypothetical protein